MYGVAGFHSRDLGPPEEERSRKGLGIMVAQKLGRRMVGVEMKRVCGREGASEKLRVVRRVARQEAGVRRIWRMKIVDSIVAWC
jgi:hypothetical protein